jgi:hypothetical protein
MWAMMEKLRIFTGIGQCSRPADSNGRDGNPTACLFGFIQELWGVRRSEVVLVPSSAPKLA